MRRRRGRRRCRTCHRRIARGPAEPALLSCPTCRVGAADADQVARWERLTVARRESAVAALDSVIDPDERTLCEGRAVGVPGDFWTFFGVFGVFTLAVGLGVARLMKDVAEWGSVGGDGFGEAAVLFIIAGGPLLIGVWWGYRVVRWRTQRWVVTDRRVLVCRGVIWRRITAARLIPGATVHVISKNREVVIDSGRTVAAIPLPPPDVVDELRRIVAALDDDDDDDPGDATAEEDPKGSGLGSSHQGH